MSVHRDRIGDWKRTGRVRFVHLGMLKTKIGLEIEESATFQITENTGYSVEVESVVQIRWRPARPGDVLTNVSFPNPAIFERS